MAYQINRYNNSLLTTVEDGTLDQTTDLKFVGRNYAGYGEVQNENFLFLLENFAGSNPPPRAVSGQVWFDNSNKKLKFYDGSKFRTTGGSEISSTEPTGLTVGDFWWDTGNDQLYVYNGTGYVLIGPQNAGEGITQMQSRSVKDTSGVSHSVIVAVVDDVPLYLISADKFTIDTTDPSAIEGFDIVKKGITLRDTKASTLGVTSTNHYFWGTASNALKLGGLDASDYVTTGSASFGSVVDFKDGITIGENFNLKIGIENTNQGYISNTVGPSNIIKFKAKDSSNDLIHSLTVKATGLEPAVDSTFNLGSSTVRFANVYADTLDGIATRADTLKEGSNYRSADSSAKPNTVAVRTGDGNITANIFQGTATSARYADLAEVYSTDFVYPVGTVVMVSQDDDAELTQCDYAGIPVGIVSRHPAYLMNSEAEGQPIGLKGRVYVRVVGKVNKGANIYSSHSGVATAGSGTYIIGVALESNDNADEKLVECVLKV